MIRPTHLFIALGFTGIVAAPGCGDEGPTDGAGSGALSSGLPKDQVVGNFSDADAQQFCAAMEKYVESDPGIRAMECHLAGFTAAIGAAFLGTATDADIQRACSEMESTCLNRLAGADAGTSTCSKPTGTCTVTVGELETCLSDSLSTMQTELAKLPSCSTIRASDLTPTTTGGPQSPQVASCAVVSDKCPDAMRSSGIPQAGAPASTGR